LLVFARHQPAAACFVSALAEQPDDRELIYPTVAALAAARRTGEARQRWEQARRAGRAPAADSLALRLLVGFSGADRASAQQEVTRLAEAVVQDPTSAPAHLELGQALLRLGSARSATLEISVACGISQKSQDIFWLAQGYDAMGARLEALEAYRAALAGGLDSSTYRVARRRLPELLRELGPGALGTISRP
jgi:predicted Zn-dependent protease